MTLIVETGTANPLSEAYASVEFADAYFLSMGNTVWAALEVVDKERALRRSAQFMCQSYCLRWKGVRVNTTQALDWPRYDVPIPDVGVYNIVDPATIPKIIVQANAELAVIASAGELNPNKSQNIVSKVIGPIKIVYDQASPQGKKFVAVEDMLAPFLLSGNGASFSLRRT